MNNTDTILLTSVFIIIALIVIININSIFDSKINNAEHFDSNNLVNNILNTESVKTFRTNTGNVTQAAQKFINNMSVNNILNTESVKTFRTNTGHVVNAAQKFINNMSVATATPTPTPMVATVPIAPISIVSPIPTVVATVSKVPPTIVTENNIETQESDIKKIEFPDDDDIVNYNGKAHFNIESFPILPNEKFKPDDNNCNNDNINDDYDINMTEIYKQKQMYVKSYFEDPTVRSYNIDTYENMSPIANTGLIKLDKDVNFPKPNGYIFKSSPVYNR